MKSTYLKTILSATLGLAVVATLSAAPATTAPASAQADAANRVDVKALTSSLQFLGDKTPVLVGNPVLLEFWATWCPPCRASISHMNELNTEYHAKGLQIVGISGEDKSTVEHFRQHVSMQYSVALDADQQLAAKFQVSTIPHAFLLNKSGQLVWSGHPMELTDEIIAKVLSAPAAL